MAGWVCQSCDRSWAPHIAACSPCNDKAAQREAMRNFRFAPSLPDYPDRSASRPVPTPDNYFHIPTITTTSLDEGFNV